jgi:hypothetical protein
VRGCRLRQSVRLASVITAGSSPPETETRALGPAIANIESLFSRPMSSTIGRRWDGCPPTTARGAFLVQIRPGADAAGVWFGSDQVSGATSMPGSFNSVSSLDFVAHIIQVALTPVFLLSGIATLLNVFSTRLARVADRVDQISKAIEGTAATEDIAALTKQLSHLRRRSIALDAAVVLGAIGGAATCASVFTLFVGALRDATVASVLFTTFGVAVACTIGAIAAFTAEMLMAGSGVRAEVAAGRRSSQQA